MVEGQDPCHNRGSRAGERSRLGVKVGDKVGSSSGLLMLFRIFHSAVTEHF